MTAPTSLTTRLATFLAPALICASLLGGCVGASQKVATSKEQGDNSTAVDENNSGTIGKVAADLRAELAALKLENKNAATASGNGYAKTTQVMGMTGLACMVVIVVLIVAMALIIWWITRMFMDLLEKIIPLINVDEHGKVAA